MAKKSSLPIAKIILGLAFAGTGYYAYTQRERIRSQVSIAFGQKAQAVKKAIAGEANIIRSAAIAAKKTVVMPVKA